MNGIVFNIQRYSIHDGPGIRTVVFLKGCSMHCLWCCNPESEGPHPEVEFRETLCQQCGNCVSSCPKGALNPDLWLATGPKIDRELCDNCGKCVVVCPSAALRMVGSLRSVGEVLAEVLRDATYYRRSGGGVTISGGEPMCQATFTRALLQACYERNVHTTVETTGCVGWSLYEEVLPFTDLFLYDLKHMDSEAHRRLTGVPNERILENVRRLASRGASIILRVPLIPGLNMDEGEMHTVAELAASLNVLEVHLMPFHQFGKDKYRWLGRTYSLAELPGLREAPDGPAKIRWARDIIASRGLKVFVGG